MKLCVDCKHCKLPEQATYFTSNYYCYHPEIVYISPITGAESPKECERVRNVNWGCGVEGKLWEGEG